MNRNIILATVFVAAVLTSFVMTGCSPASAGGPSTPPAPTAPAEPTGVAAAAAFDAVTLSWPAVAGATSYNLYWSTSTGVTTGNGTAIDGVTSPYNCTGTNGTAYYYVVTAVNAVGESAASSQVAATPSGSLPPAAPTGVTATPVSTTGVDILWTAAAGATSYNLYWSTPTGLGTGGTKITGVTSLHHETGLATGTPYYYVVTAVGTGGESAASAQVSAAPAPFVTGSVATNAADGTALNEQINVYTSNGGPGIAGLVVKLNGTTMADQGSGRYGGTVVISLGASISLDVADSGTHYTVSATNFTSGPTVTAPASGATWSHATPNDSISWTGGYPLTGASYLVAVADSTFSSWYYGNGSHGPIELPTSTLSASVPASSWTMSFPGSYPLNVLMGVSTAGMSTQTGGIPVVGALPSSAIWIAVGNLVPITVD